MKPYHQIIGLIFWNRWQYENWNAIVQIRQQGAIIGKATIFKHNSHNIIASKLQALISRYCSRNTTQSSISNKNSRNTERPVKITLKSTRRPRTGNTTSSLNHSPQFNFLLIIHLFPQVTLHHPQQLLILHTSGFSLHSQMR
uniref:Uncharacterized protein n=1 Tax=Opuntia streptacantha TaxID=393608 RepID=A0A7C9EYC0_OPUST